MNRALVVLLIILLVLMVAAAGYLWALPEAARSVYVGWGAPEAFVDWVADRLGVGGATPELIAIVASGSIEADEVTVAAELTGRVSELLAAQGDTVRAGQQLVQLDETALLADLGEAEAAVEVAHAALAEAQASPRASEIEAKAAAVAQAEAQVHTAATALRSAETLRDAPLELAAQIDAARSQVTVLAGQVEQARAALKATEIARDSGNPYGSDREKTEVAAYEKRVEAAQERLAAAQAAHEGAQGTVAALEAVRRQPLALDARVHAAQSQMAVAEAALELAKSELALLLAGPRAETVALAEAQVQQAETALLLLQVRQDKLVVRSPMNGIITNQVVEVGETAVAGRPLLTLADLQDLSLEVFVPTDRIGWVRVGQEAEVVVDAFPGRVFVGTVTYIAPEAEFTPRNVQTKEERVNTVFAVRIKIDDADLALKPGMPADAALEPQISD
jgi:HlyD family secretion protein